MIKSGQKNWDNIGGCYSKMDLGFEEHYWVSPHYMDFLPGGEYGNK